MQYLQIIPFKQTARSTRFDEKGFVTLGVAPASTLEKIQEIYDAFSVNWQRTGFYSSMMIEDLHYRNQVSDQLSQLVSPLLQHILGAHEILFSNFLIKLPRTDNHIGIHQDWNFVDETKAESINFWIPLTDVDDTNGNLYMAEKSQNHFLHPRGTPYLNYFRNFEVALEQISTPLYPKRGEIILYHGRIVHFSKPNLSGKERIAIGGVLVPKEASFVHLRHNQHEEQPEWRQYHVDKKFFETFVPDNPDVSAYPSVPLLLPRDYFSPTNRSQIIQAFINQAKAR